MHTDPEVCSLIFSRPSRAGRRAAASRRQRNFSFKRSLRWDAYLRHTAHQRTYARYDITSAFEEAQSRTLAAMSVHLESTLDQYIRRTRNALLSTSSVLSRPV